MSSATDLDGYTRIFGGTVDMGAFESQVAPTNTAPVVSAGADSIWDEGTWFEQVGSFTDPDADEWSATADYGDGSGVVALSLREDKTFALSHKYADNGTYTITVSVSDGTESSSDTVEVRVWNVAPTVDAGEDTSIVEGGILDRYAYFTDPGDDTYSATVDYGGGSEAAVSEPDANQKQVILYHTYAVAGSYIVTVTVTDGDDGDDSDTFTVTVTEPLSVPEVTTHPQDLTVEAGQTATFTAAATGNPAPSVHWKVSTDGSTWAEITGATSTTLSFTAQLADSGKQYRAVFSDSAGSAATNPATLTVTALVYIPTVFTHPAGQTVTVGATVTFTAAATASPAPNVQWQVSKSGGKNWKDIGGANSETYSFTAQINENGNQYRAVFTNSAGSTASNAAVLTVVAALVAPEITAQPADQSVPSGGTATFAAAASGNPAPNVQWQQSTDSGANWGDIGGATSTVLTLSGVAPEMNGYQYRAAFTNAVGTAFSNPATLSVTGGGADLSIAKAGVYNAETNTITWTLTVSNAGPDTAEGVVVTDTVPKGTKTVTVENAANFKITGPRATVTLDALSSGGSVSFVVVSQLSDRVTFPVDNTASVTSTTFDPDLSNNTVVGTVAEK